MALSTSHSTSHNQQELLQRLGPPAPRNEDYWPMVGSAAGTALLAVLTQLGASLILAVQWQIPVEVHRWSGVVPHLVFATTRPRFEEIVYWSMLTSAVVLVVFSLSGLLAQRRLQVQAGRLFAWLDISFLGLAVLLRKYVWNYDVGAESFAWLLTLGGVVGFVVGLAIVRARFLQRQQMYGTHFSHLEGRFV